MRLVQGVVRIAQMSDTGGAVDLRFDASELDQHAGTIGSGHRLLQRPPQ